MLHSRLSLEYRQIVISLAHLEHYVHGMKFARRIVILLCLILPLPLAATAADGWPSDVAKIEFITGWKTKTGSQMAALRVRLAPGWKTYWRAPGETGVPPRFSWSGSRNLKTVLFHWPSPTVFDLNGTRTIGYENELVLPIEFFPLKDGEIMVKAEFELGLCRDVCLPVTGHLSARLEGIGLANPLISTSLKNRPEGPISANIGRVGCSVEPIADGLRVTAEIEVQPLGKKEVAVIEFADQTIWVSEAITNRATTYLVTTADMVPPNGAPFLLDRSKVTITLFGGGRAIEIPGCPSG